MVASNKKMMCKEMVSLALVGLLLFSHLATTVSAAHLIKEGESEEEGRVVYADMKMASTDSTSDGPAPAPSPSSKRWAYAGAIPKL
ncbi:hypothetical protein GUJ93_ZPchr0005g14807 [Zizania palustris]|uniref:Transmembrane protein n=1 Tax=Zizania palustris TaxID=103762 RepID=A0A8J5SHL2_ZIZPA|nr:hypothetical protein GUJ93_ZPchr0005g14807 [Zizania palustris]